MQDGEMKWVLWATHGDQDGLPYKSNFLSDFLDFLFYFILFYDFEET